MHGLYARRRNSSGYTRGYTCSAWLNRFFKLHFFVIKQAKMYFVFKVSFLLHRVTNQNFKKKKKSNRELKKHRKKSLDDVTTAVTTCTQRGPCTVVCAHASFRFYLTKPSSLLFFFFSVCSKPQKDDHFS